MSAGSSDFQNDSHRFIYKVCPLSVWQAIQSDESWEGSLDDLRDGFIHFSNSQQLSGTLEKHFSGQKDLVLLAVDPASLGAELRWERSRGGDLFPHLYGRLPIAAVVSAEPVNAV